MKSFWLTLLECTLILIIAGAITLILLVKIYLIITKEGMYMKFILKRFLWSVLVLIGLSILIFIIARVVPGDPARMALGPRASEEAIQQLTKELNLDKPLATQYFLWVKGVFKGDLGKSIMSRRPVLDDIKEFLPATLEVIFLAAFIEIVGGILLGTISARYSGKWIDNVVRIISYLGIATPAFVWSIILMLIFGYLIPVLPILGRIDASIIPPPTVTGFMVIDSILDGNMEALSNAILHLIMPAISLALAGLSQASRIHRSSMLDNFEKDYVGTELSSGIPMKKVLLKYVMKPSLISTVSIIALDIAFNYPGISRYGINAMLNKDLNAITAIVMIIGIAFLLVNIIVDIIAAYLDPRIRLQGGAK